MSPIQNEFPDLPKPKTKRDREVDALRERARMMTGQAQEDPIVEAKVASRNQYAKRTYKRLTPEQRIFAMEQKARSQIRRAGSLSMQAGTMSGAVYSNMLSEAASFQPQTTTDSAKSSALKRLSEVQGDPGKWRTKNSADKLKMLVAGGVYGVFNAVVTGAGDPAANGIYEPDQPYNNRPQWKSTTRWSIYWRDVSKGKRKGGHWVIQGKDHTYQYKCTKNDVIPPAGATWLKLKGKAPGPKVNYKERAEPKQIDT